MVRATGSNGVQVAVNGGSATVNDIPAPKGFQPLGVAVVSSPPGGLIPGPGGKLWFTRTQYESTINLLTASGTPGTFVSYPSPVTTSAGMPLASDAAGNASARSSTVCSGWPGHRQSPRRSRL